MNSTKELNNLFDDFNTDVLSVADFGITYNGVLITHIFKENGIVHIYAGNPAEDKYSEELIIKDKSEFDAIIEQVSDNF